MNAKGGRIQDLSVCSSWMSPMASTELAVIKLYRLTRAIAKTSLKSNNWILLQYTAQVKNYERGKQKKGS